MTQIVKQLLGYFLQGSFSCKNQSEAAKAAGSRGQCCATDSDDGGVERLEEAEKNVHLSALSLAVITPFELPLPLQGASGFFSYVQHYQADSWALEKRPSFVPVHATSIFLGLQMLLGMTKEALRRMKQQ